MSISSDFLLLLLLLWSSR